MKFIEAQNLSKIYRRGYPDQTQALSDVSFEIDKGSCVLVSGSSGCGKTTLLSLMACLSRPTSGKYFIDEEQVSSLPERFLSELRKKRVGVVFQHFNLIDTLSVELNIILGLIPEGLGGSVLSQRAFVSAQKVSIEHKLKSLPTQLSGGEKQRVAIARALVFDPPIICADEPTAHLDTNTSHTILKEFENLKLQGKTLILTSHDPFVQQHQIIDQKLTLHSGKLV